MIKINSINALTDLKRFETWKNMWVDKNSMDIFSYISEKCNPEDVLIFCKMLFPDFVVTDGCVVLEMRFNEENFKSWHENFNGNVKSIESFINHIHLYDVFDHCSETVDDVIYLQLAEVIAVSWRMLLKDKFPDKQFLVVVSNTQQDYGPTITFYQSQA